MLLGPGEIINCPSCKETFLKQDLISGNTFGGIYFSDGKNHFPMLPDLPQFACCETCHAFFWLKDVPYKELPRSYGSEEIPAGEDIPYIQQPSAEEFAEAITLKCYRNPEEEEYLRRHLWWELNNKFRGGRKGEMADQTLFVENLKALIRLKQSAEPQDLLMLAEMHRELGLFDEALELLKNVKEDRLKSIVRQFREKIKQKDRMVFRLN
jgi:hypothetical protein